MGERVVRRGVGERLPGNTTYRRVVRTIENSLETQSRASEKENSITHSGRAGLSLS